MHRKLFCVLRLISVAAALAAAGGCTSSKLGGGAAPIAPQGLSVSQSGLREVTLGWAVSSGGAAKYKIERAEAADGKFETIGEVSPRKGTFIDQGKSGAPLKDSADYFYRLVAVSDTGRESPPSEAMKSTTAPPPDPPAGLAATTPKSRGVKLTWKASPSAGIVLYRVERTEAAQPDAFKEIADVASAEYMDGGTASSTLKDSTRYLYRVSSINRVKSVGKPCEPVEVTTAPPPAPPKKVAGESRQVRCVPLTWEASPEADVVRYDVYRGNSSKGPFEKIGSVSDRTKPQFLDGKTDPGSLEDEAAYFYRIRAINEVTSESADSEVASATTREVPPRIENVRAHIRQPREVPVYWQASPDEKVLGYEIWRAEGEGSFDSVGRIGGRLLTNYIDRGGIKQFPDVSLLKDDTVYSYKIIAFNTAYARSSASAPVSSQTKALPAQPAMPETTTNLPRAIAISWPVNSETDIVAYAVEVSPDGSTFKPLASVPAQKNARIAAIREDGLGDGVEHRYRVRAIDKDRLIGPWSETVAGRSKPLPGAPAALKQEPVAAGVRIYWEQPDQPDIKAYKIYSKTTFGSEPYAVTEVPEFIVEWPVLKSQLKLMISAIDADNLEGARSDAITVTPRETPKPAE